MRRAVKRLWGAVRRLLASPAFLISLALVLAAWFAIGRQQPVITRVPVVVPGTELIVEGNGFGSQQRGSTVRLETKAGARKSAEPTAWSDSQIRIPAPESGGTVQVVKRVAFFDWPTATVPFVVQAAGLPSEPFGYQVPVQPNSPWPTFRRDRRNTGYSPLPADHAGDRPWAFRTGKGIFSTPVIAGDGTVYVGSADHVFYALNPDGTEKWRFETGEIIDSAAALPGSDTHDGRETVVFPSGDGFLYHLDAADGALIDTFEAPGEFYNRWWEANIAVGYDETLYAGNTNFNYYAITPDLEMDWVFETGANAWTNAGLADDGTVYWGSLDTYAYAVDPAGREKWRKMTLGFIAASAAVGTDGTVYVGSFDSYLYALDPQTGRVKWKFKTGDHIYSSAALPPLQFPPGRGELEGGPYFGSTDGIFYALNTDGELLWRYDTGDPIRSSPAIGGAPTGEWGEIVYFGAGNGKLYALNAADGSRRWSFDTTSEEPELRDRNDLNGSPALGQTGIYIAGEHGYVWYVPYDYCLHNNDPRCQTDPGEDLPDDTAGLFYVTPGGSTLLEGTPTIPPASVITLHLLVRQAGETIDAWVCNSPIGCSAESLIIRAEPDFPFRVEKSADGHYLHIVPEDILAPDTLYTLRVAGNTYTGGLNVGNLTLGGRKLGRFEDEITFKTTGTGAALPLAVGEDQTSALEWTRLAVPIPSFMPSVNQIGFDYMDWIIGAVDVGKPDENGAGKAILWAIGGQRDENGVLVAEPDTDFTLPLSGRYRGSTFILSNRDFNMPVTGIPIPFNLLQLRGTLGQDLRVEPGATVFADTEALSIPTFGPSLVIAGLANNWWEKLVVAGTYVTRPYQADGPANRRPEGVGVTAVTFDRPSAREEGRVSAAFSLAPGARYPVDQHNAGILLVDTANREAVFLDYHANLHAESDPAGNLSAVTLTIPAGTELPERFEAVVMLDVFPAYRQTLARDGRP